MVSALSSASQLRRWASVAAPVVVYVALPVGSLARGLVLAVTAVVVTGLLAVTAGRVPVPASRTWALVATYPGFMALSDGVFAVQHATRGQLPTGLSTWSLLYPVAVLGLVLGLRRLGADHPAHATVSRIDQAMVAVLLTLTAVALLLGPVWQQLGDTPVTALQVVAFPLLLLGLAGTALRVVMTGAGRTPAERLLLAAAAAVLVGSVVVSSQLVTGSWQPLRWPPAIMIAALALLGVASSAAGAERLGASSAPSDRGRSSRTRVLLLGATTLVLPALQLALLPTLRGALLAGGTAVVLLLVTARMSELVGELDRLGVRELRDQRARDERRFASLVRHASDVVLVIDTAGQVSYASPSAGVLLGHDPTGRSIRALLRSVHPDDRRTVIRALRTGATGGGDAPLQLTTRLVDHLGEVHDLEVVAVDLRHDPDVAGLLLTVHEVTARVQLEQELRHLAFHDPLTGLANRQLLRERVEQARLRARRDGHQLGVLVCDIDGFRDINETVGYGDGDHLLRTIGARLSSVVQETDTVARTAGDEFTVLCEELDGARAALVTARRLVEAVRAPLRIADREVALTISIGVVVDTGERSVDDLLRDADVALREAKLEGSERWVLHRPVMTSRARARIELAADLHEALTAGHGITAAFQPIVELGSATIVGMEALARWQHPERGFVSPGEFVPVAEQSGLILALGDHMLDLSLRTLHGLRVTRPDLVLRLGVNLSARQLRQPGLVGRIAELLAAYEVPPSWLVLELTESVMLDDVDLALTVMRQLRSFGVRFAVDDFGTGYSSLSYLRRLPVDIVKIDRSFIADLGDDAAAGDLVRIIIELSRSLDLDVLAEGVETERQRELLLDLGCGFAQGYLFDRPLTPEVLQQRLQAPSTSVVHATPGRSSAAPGIAAS